MKNLPNPSKSRRERPFRALSLALFLGAFWCVHAQAYDLVITEGRVLDPESGLDAMRHVGIKEGKIAAISAEPLSGSQTISAAGLVVAPGFIDLHQHGQTAEDYAFKVADGVTTVFELEVGTADVPSWYAQREGKSPVHFGVSIGHIPVRMAVMGDRPDFLPPSNARSAVAPATEEQIDELKKAIALGLKQGAVAVGFGIQYTPSASQWEVLEMFRVAAQFQASCHVHIRSKGENRSERGVEALEEVIAASAISGAPLHVVHIQSTGGAATPRLLDMIAAARAHSVDVTTECYPYTAGMTDIRSSIFDKGWRANLGIDYSDLQWPPTGERLTAETFALYRQQGGLVIAHTNPESVVQAAVAHPLTMIASDGFLQHPRGAGTYARVLGGYVREKNALSLMDALRKMTLEPARRLEKRTPSMADKGRIRLGADADLCLFDPDRIADRATFEKPRQSSTGIQYVLVGGVPVVYGGQLRPQTFPGRPVRAPAR